MHILFGLHTLFVPIDPDLKFTKKSHAFLTSTEHDDLDLSRYSSEHSSTIDEPRYELLGTQVFPINQHEMSTIFTKILSSEKIQIGFLSETTMKKEDVFAFLENIYGLPKNSLSNCIYYNGLNAPGGYKMHKGSIMQTLCEEKIISPKSFLIDNSYYHIIGAREHKFAAIHTDIFDEEHKYILDINNILRIYLKPQLPQLSLANKAPKSSTQCSLQHSSSLSLPKLKYTQSIRRQRSR